MIDNQFIKTIKSECNKNISFIDEIAIVLDINYDASYRRINGRTSISLKEAVKLAKHFNVSLNDLFKIGDKNIISITKTTDINSLKSLETYFENFNIHINSLEFNEKNSIFYSAKELPIFYVLKDNLLFRFKIYVWLQILNKNEPLKKIKFDDYRFPASLIETALLTGKKYDNIRISEMWNFGIINSTLNQILYFFEARLLSYKSAVTICNDLKKILKNIEESTLSGKRNNKNKTPFKLYHNQILNLNNNILIKANNKKVLFSPYSLLQYYRIENQVVCNNMDQFFKEQRHLSKQITNSGIKDIILFFRPKYNKIDKLLKQLDLLNRFPLH